MKKTRHQRKGNVWFSYELQVKSDSGEVVRLILPEEKTNDEQLGSIVGLPVVALFKSNEDVWELASGGLKRL